MKKKSLKRKRGDRGEIRNGNEQKEVENFETKMFVFWNKNQVRDKKKETIFLKKKMKQKWTNSETTMLTKNKRPRQWASSFPVIPTNCVDVNGGGAKQLETLWERPRTVEFQRQVCDVWCDVTECGPSPRKIRSMDASGARRVADTVSGVAIEPQPGEQVVCQDLTGELSDSLSEIRKETRSWNTKWRCVFVNHIPQSSTVVCCHERELRGFVHGDDFILVTGDYVQLIWIESSDVPIWGSMMAPMRRSRSCGRIWHLRCPILWLRGADRHNKKFDCTNESGVREIRERRDPGVHSRLHRELSGGGGSDENHECAQVDDFQDVKTEVAVFMMGPNEEESMEHACSKAWFDALWMREGIEVPTMVQSDVCMERRVRCVLIPSAEFECCLVRVSQSDVEWDQFCDWERTEGWKLER